MSLFDAFTAPKWQHKKPEIRLQAIEELDDTEVLLELVRTDPDEKVRSAALARINGPDQLEQLIPVLTGALQQQTRSQLLNQLLPDPAAIATLDDESTLIRVAGLTDDPALVVAAIGQMKSQERLMKLAIDHPVAKVRLTAAEMISDIDQMQELMSQAKGHDKSVYRHCKNVVEQHQEQQQKKADQKERLNHLLQDMEQLVNEQATAGYKSRFLSLQQQWQNVAVHASSDQSERFQALVNKCETGLQDLARERAEEQQRQAERDEARQAFEAVIAELDGIQASAENLKDDSSIASLKDSLQSLKDRWETVASNIDAPESLSKSYQALMTRWQNLCEVAQRLLKNAPRLESAIASAEKLDATDFDALHARIGKTRQLLANFSWPDTDTAPPQEVTDLQSTLASLEKKMAKLVESEPDNLQKLGKFTDKLRVALDENHVKDAERNHLKARRICKSLSPKQRQAIEHDLGPLSARLREMQDWQGFAIEPKKRELCERMASLAASVEDSADTAPDVDVLAEKIKSLQNEWKALGALPHAVEQDLWLQFKASADEAWKPCKAAFKARDAALHQNYRQRMELVKQLREYEARMAWPDAVDKESGVSEKASETAGPSDGSDNSDRNIVTEESASENISSDTDVNPEEGKDDRIERTAKPDWRMVQKTLDTARSAFREIKPVKPGDDRKSYRAFKAVCDQIYAHVKSEYGRNIEAKEALVAAAQELPSEDDLSKAIDSAKQLQQQWKSVGITPVAVDRKLWKNFRTACDAVFARLDQERAQNQAESDATVSEAESLVQEAMKLVNEQAESLGMKLPTAVAELKSQFYALTLPRPAQQRLAKEILGVEKKAQQAVEQWRRQAEAANWLCLEYRLKACAIKPKDETAANDLWNSAGEIPRDIDDKALATFWDKGPADEAESEWRLACIALEVLGEIESPEEDKEARMNYQMQRLVEGIGTQTEASAEVLPDHINAFIQLRPAEPWVSRFLKSVGQIRG